MSDWRTNKRPGTIPRTLRELEIGAEAVFRYDADPPLAPNGKLWDRVTYYISRERARYRREAGIPKVSRPFVKGDNKMFVRTRVENVGVRVTRVR